MKYKSERVLDENRWVRINPVACPVDGGEWVDLGTFEGAYSEVYPLVVKTVNEYLDALGLSYNQLGLYWQPKDIHRLNSMATCHIDDPTERYGFDEAAFLQEHTEQLAKAFVAFTNGEKHYLIALVNRFVNSQIDAEKRIETYINGADKLSWGDVERERFPELHAAQLAALGRAKGAE